MVTVDDKLLGSTPLIVKLSRKDNHILRMELAGYLPFEATITRKTSGWVWGNVVFGGLIGLAVDAVSGGLYTLTPEQVAGQMARQTASMTTTPEGLYVTFVQRADPSWQRIGTLAR